MISHYKRNRMTKKEYRKAKKMKNVFDFDEKYIQINPCITFIVFLAICCYNDWNNILKRQSLRGQESLSCLMFF